MARLDSLMQRHWTALVILLLLMMGTMVEVTSAVQNFTLGFLSPSMSSEIPPSLVTEWESAFRVAVEVMNTKSEKYNLWPHSVPSGCNWEIARTGAHVMMLPNDTIPPLLGVVGPACTPAAMSAAIVLSGEGYPLVSFAATGEPLSNRDTFPNFFRTVYGDSFQAEAVAACIGKLNMSSVTIIYTQGQYALNLANNIETTVNGTANLRMEMLKPGDNLSIDVSQLDGILSSLQPLDFVILVVNPQEAQDIWAVASQEKRLEFPWWYFGTDGVTAFNPADQIPTDPTLVNELVGEIGLSPYGGGYAQNDICEEYYSYWQVAKYPGLPTGPQNNSRSYTPYLIDTVRVYFEVCDALLAHNLSITAENVMSALNGSGPLETQPNFQGCTGLVAIDPTTGSRSAKDQIPIYDLVSLVPQAWEVKGRIENGNFVTLQPLTRPNSEFAPNSTYTGPNPHKRNVGAIVGSLFAVIVILSIVAIAVYFYKRRKQREYRSSRPFVRVPK
ncbi:unnamed protein product [Sphagnum jensenii]|uniref:Receptor ligand binding region domain-containing protein n=1 Tax=Sphagnum jensenii TaxID=128206 RepID=A0ABP1B017_9BRYO